MREISRNNQCPSEEQVEIVERITAPLLKEFYAG
jgi:hypothetical protein